MSTAAAQHGAVSVRQLRDAGWDSRAQRTAINGGWLQPVCPGVFVVAGSPDTWYRRLHAGLLALEGRGWVSHEAAAALLGLDRSPDEPLEFTVPRSARGLVLPPALTVHTAASVGPVDVLRVGGLRCSSATRCILDLAHVGATERRLAAAIDSAVRLGLSAPLVLARRLEEMRGPGRRGVAILERLLDDSGGESMLERRFLQLVRTSGLPRPTLQRRIYDGARHVARVDFLYEHHRLVVEVTGRRGHSTPLDRSRDAQRRNELQDLGYRVYEYTWTDVNRRPRHVLATLSQRLSDAPASSKATQTRRSR